MGQRQSSFTKIRNEVENTLSVNERKTLQNNCVSTTSGSNIINISDSNVSDVKFNLKNEIENLCFLSQALNQFVSNKTNTELASKIAEEQMNSSSFSSNESTTKSYNFLKTKIGINSVIEVYNNCLQSVDFTNVINISNSTVSNTELELQNKAFNECLQQSLLDLAQENDLSSELDAELKKSQSITSSTNFILIIIVLIVIILAFLIWKFRKIFLGPLGWIV